MSKTKQELENEVEEVRLGQEKINRKFFWSYTGLILLFLTLLVNNLKIQLEPKLMLLNIGCGVIFLVIIYFLFKANTAKRKLSKQRKSLIKDLQADLAKISKNK